MLESWSFPGNAIDKYVGVGEAGSKVLSSQGKDNVLRHEHLNINCFTLVQIIRKIGGINPLILTKANRNLNVQEVLFVG